MCTVTARRTCTSPSNFFTLTPTLSPRRGRLLGADLVRPVIGALLFAASFRDGLGPLHHERTTEFAQSAGWLGFDSVFAIRIIGAAVEDTITPATFGHFAFVTHGTLYASGDLRSVFVLLDKFALWVIVAGDELAILSIALDEFAFLTLRTFFTRVLGAFDRFPFEGEGTSTFGEG